MLKTIIHTITSGQKININELSKHHDKICFFDSNIQANSNQKTGHSKLLAIGSIQEHVTNEKEVDFIELDKFITQPNQWKFGYLTYDVKNSIEELNSNNNNFLNFPLLHFFVPKFLNSNRSN